MSLVTWASLLGGVSLTIAVVSLLLLTAVAVEVRRLEAVRRRWETDRAALELLLTALRAVLQPSAGTGPWATGSERTRSDGPH
jgi:hypothetical protein